jgi:hypothetical protein
MGICLQLLSYLSLVNAKLASRKADSLELPILKLLSPLLLFILPTFSVLLHLLEVK